MTRSFQKVGHIHTKKGRQEHAKGHGQGGNINADIHFDHAIAMGERGTCLMDVLVFMISGTLAAATALIFAAMGELVAEKSGMLNLGIEGMMATGAAMGFVAATVSGSYTLGS